MPAQASALPRSSPLRSAQRVLGQWLAGSEYLVLWLSLIYIAAAAPFTPGFFTPENAGNIALTLLPLFLVAVGQTIVLITGGIDLSVTAVIGLASIVGAMVMNDTNGWLAGSAFAAPATVAIMMLVGMLVGLANGLAIVRLRMPAFLVTLTTMMFFSGFAIWLTQSRNINALPTAFTALGSNIWIAGAITAVIGVGVHALLARTLFGQWLYAVGHNPRAALISGVPVAGISIAAYVLSGGCAALAAVLYTGQAETGSPVLGQRVLLDVIGATVLGGTSLFGGRGKVLWTLCGVLFLKLVDNSLNLLSLSVFTITMVKGGVILGAALLDASRRRISRSAA